MTLFQPSYLKEGPGIDKDAPPKRGLALLLEILVREFWQIIKVNLLFLVCALPLVTFGAARAALSRCTMNMVRDVPNDVWPDFFRAFRQDFSRSTAVGLAELFWLGLCLAALSTDTVHASIPLTGAVCAVLVAGGLFFSYLWPMLVTIDVPAAAAVRNAAALAFGCLHHSLPALLTEAVLLASGLWFFPLSLPLVLLIPFGMSSFFTSFAAWSDIRRLIVSKSTKGVS